MKLPLNTSVKLHFKIAALVSLWLVLFLIIIGPFDVSDLDFQARLIILPFYGVLSFATYTLLIPIQNRMYHFYKMWHLGFEIIFLALYVFILLFLCFAYYKTDLVNGEYNFQTFALYVYLPDCLIVLTIIIFLRWFFNRKATITHEEKITITGDSKLDILHILPNELICVSSADNYVEIFYLNQNKLEKKLVRNTLKQVQKSIPFLVRIHRSHLINPSHFKSWKSNNTIILTQIEVPVSKTYKSVLFDLEQSSQKTDISPQS